MSGNKRTAAAKEAALIEMYVRGDLIYKIRAELHIGGDMYPILARHGIKLRGMKSGARRANLTPEMVAVVISDYKNGSPLTALASFAHCNTDRIKETLKENGVPLRKRNDFTPEWREIIMDPEQIVWDTTGQYWDMDALIAKQERIVAREQRDVDATLARGKAVVLHDLIDAYADARKAAGIV